MSSEYVWWDGWTRRELVDEIESLRRRVKELRSSEVQLIRKVDEAAVHGRRVADREWHTRLAKGRSVLIDVLIAHQRASPRYCSCGWGELGRSHAAHIADTWESAMRGRPGGDAQ